MTSLNLRDDAEPTALNPRRSVYHLSNVIGTIDFNLNRPSPQMRDPAIRHRVIYLRNTLIVSLDLWQNDLEQRVNRSRARFYVFCMTEGEKFAFTRRMVPALQFAAEELRNINAASLSHLVATLERTAADAAIYAAQNKACLKLAIDDQNEYPTMTHPAITR
jgi:hypothetical protein